MAKTFEVKARFVAENKATPEIKKIESGFKRLTKTIKSSAIAQIAAFGGVVVALRGLVRGIGKSIDAAAEQEKAINALEGSLATLGSTADKVSKSLQAQASELQNVSRFGDETIIQAQSLIAAFVKEEDQIKAATIATLDFAEAKSISLVNAADLIAKTLGSSTNALTRYGIAVEGAVGSSERLESLTSSIAEVFGGRAQNAIDTYSGSMDQLKNAVGDTAEAIGRTITENELFLTIIQATTEALVVFNNTPDRFESIAINMDAVSASAARQGKTVEGLINTLALYDPSLAQVVDRQAQWTEEIEKARVAEAGLEASLANLARAFEVANEAAKADFAETFVAASEDADRVLRKLGVTIEQDVKEKVERYEDALVQLRIETDAGIRTSEEYRNAQVAIGREIAAVEAGFKSYADQQRELTDATRDHIDELDRQSLGLDRATDSTLRLIDAQRILTQEQQREVRLSDPNRRGRFTNFDLPGGVFTSNVDSTGRVIP